MKVDDEGYSWRQIGPAMSHARPAEMLRAGFGVFFGLVALELVALLIGTDGRLALFLIAPFGATAFLLFAVPNAPLAQPWSATVGNTVSALAALAAIRWVADPFLQAAVAVGAAVVLMHLARALHPPGGAVALSTVLAADAIPDPQLIYILSPVCLGTLILVIVAAIYNPLTGRHYPFRQIHDHSNRPDDPPERNPLGLTREQLADLLSDFRQSSNIGVEDLARIIAGAEDRSASMRLGSKTCGDIMSRDLVYVTTEAPLARVATLFNRYGFTALPVVRDDGDYVGMIFQWHLIRRASEEAVRLRSRFLDGVVAILDPAVGRTVRAAAVMQVDGPVLTPQSPVIELLPILSHGKTDAVAIVEGNRVVGIVTRTDLVATLAQALVRRSNEAGAET